MENYVWIYNDTSNDNQERFFYKEEKAFAHLRGRFLEKGSPNYVREDSELDEVEIVKKEGFIRDSEGLIFSIKKVGTA